MHNKQIRKLLKKAHPNSGFTLIELLTGLIMSIFVTGALGFGLYQIMSATGAEKAKENARSEASRAIEFISDELRRAQTIEDNPTKATGFDSDGKTVVLALNIPELNSSSTLDSDNNPATQERIVYYLTGKTGNWQGPQVLYRWGPPLGANGGYTVNNWTYEPLIDGIDDTPIKDTDELCDDGYELTTSNPSGFYACINNTSTAAQIFLTGGIDANVIAGNDTNYTAETKAVARAKNVTVDAAMATAVSPITFRSLEADYVCDTEDIVSTADDEIWTMRTDFDNSPYGSSGVANDPLISSTNRTAGNMDKATQWIHEAGRQAQPIDIDSNNDLTLYSTPVESTDCLNETTTANEGLSKTTNLSDLVDGDPVAYHNVSHTIKFKQEVTDRPGGTDTNYYKTFNGNTANGYDNPNVTADGRVQAFKTGSIIEEGGSIDTSGNDAPARGYPGYDPDGDGPAPYRQSLGEFLEDKGYAKCIQNCGDGSTKSKYDKTKPRKYEIIKLNPNERIIAFEVGHTDNGADDGNASPGFDLQDNIFIMTHNEFEKEH